jgi:hypothetical protein
MSVARADGVIDVTLSRSVDMQIVEVANAT